VGGQFSVGHLSRLWQFFGDMKLNHSRRRVKFTAMRALAQVLTSVKESLALAG